jgi:hypothetical protein
MIAASLSLMVGIHPVSVVAAPADGRDFFASSSFSE